jgi:hypothetical protein
VDDVVVWADTWPAERNTPPNRVMRTTPVETSGFVVLFIMI